MANTVYYKFLEQQAKKIYAWDSGTTVYALLVDNTSTYDPSGRAAMDETVQDLIDAGLVELSGYSRQRLDNKTVTIATDGVEYSGDSVNFGVISAGSTIIAVVFYVNIGTDAQNYAIAYIDDATGLPKATGGGAIIMNPSSEGYFKIAQCPTVGTTTTGP